MGPLGVLQFRQVIDRGKHRHCITKIFSTLHFVSCFGVIHPCWALQTTGLSSFQPPTSHNCNVSYSDIPLEFRISSSQISECIYIYLYGYFLLSSSWWMASASRTFQQSDLSSPEISPSNKWSAWIQEILGMVECGYSLCNSLLSSEVWIPSFKSPQISVFPRQFQSCLAALFLIILHQFAVQAWKFLL